MKCGISNGLQFNPAWKSHAIFFNLNLNQAPELFIGFWTTNQIHFLLELSQTFFFGKWYSVYVTHTHTLTEWLCTMNCIVPEGFCALEFVEREPWCGIVFGLTQGKWLLGYVPTFYIVHTKTYTSTHLIATYYNNSHRLMATKMSLCLIQFQQQAQCFHNQIENNIYLLDAQYIHN